MPEEEPPWQADQDLGRDSDAVPLGLDGMLAASAPEAAVLTVGGMIQQICTTGRPELWKNLPTGEMCQVFVLRR